MTTDAEVAVKPVEQFRPDYLRVWGTFFRNSLVREMTFRSNFIITLITRALWFASQLILFEIIYRNVDGIAGWSREEYFAFMATSMLINALVETFFMPNCANFSELIRTGNLDFALLKPIDTQFLISFEKVNLAMLNQVLLSICLLVYSLVSLGREVSPMSVVMYVLLIIVGTLFFYSLMIILASTSVWFGRNQGLYDFWFYITVFARYPAGIYSGSPAGEVLRFAFSYIMPILLVVTVPAQIVVSMTLEPGWIAFAAIGLTFATFLVSRRVFRWSLTKYRSASS